MCESFGNLRHAAESLEEAMRGRGVDSDRIWRVINEHSSSQRQQIALEYKAMYGKDLIETLKSELGGDFEKLILAMMIPRYEFDARQIRKAVKGIGTDERALIDVLATANRYHISLIAEAYRELYGEEMETSIIHDTSGVLQRILVALSAEFRDDECCDSRLKANQAAHQLLNDESVDTCIRIFSINSASQLLGIFEECDKIRSAPQTIEKLVKRVFSGLAREAMLAIVKCVCEGPAAYFAERIHEAMRGLGTNDDALIRLIVTRSEIDLAVVRDTYERKYGKRLEDEIESECSGAYKTGLLTLVRHAEQSISKLLFA